MKHIVKQSLAVVVAVTSMVGVSSQADVILSYDFGTIPSPTLDTTTNIAGVTGSTITAGAGAAFLGTASGGLGYADEPVLLVRPNGFSTAAAAVTGDAYFSFSLNPGTQVLDLDSLSFQAARGGGPVRGYDVRSSVDGFAATLGTADLDTQRPNFTDVTIDLDNIVVGGDADAFATITTPTEFRVYFYSPTAGNSIEFDNIVVNGVIPEPASLALLGIGGICGLTRRRR